MERIETPLIALIPGLLAPYQQIAGLEAAAILYQRAQDALRDSEMRFQTLVQESLQGILIHRNHQPLFTNQAFATMFGYTRPEDILSLETILPLIAPQDRPWIMIYGDALMRGDPVPFQYEYQGLRQDGAPLWVEVRATVVSWNGAPAMLGAYIDITARKQAATALARYHLLAEQARDIILFLRPDGQIVDVNQAAVAAYGYDRATLLTMTIADLRDPATTPRLDTLLAQANQRGICFESLHRRQDGSLFPVEVSSTGTDLDGERLLLHIVRDITERKQAEALREQLAAIVESSDDAIIGKTLEGIITIWNRGAERLYGYTAAEVLGRPLALLIPPDMPDDLPEILARLRRGERIEHYETQSLHKDGTRLDVSLSISPIHDSTGRIIGASKIARDITARKRAEAALQQACVALEQCVEARTAALHQEMAVRQRLERVAQQAERFSSLGRVAATLVHEIRSPLGAIFLHVDLLEEELSRPSPDSPAQIAEMLANLKALIVRLDELVQDSLSLVRVAISELTPQDMRTVVQAWAAEIQELARARGITLRLDGLADLGYIAMNVSALRRAVLNLVQNALDAMSPGGTLTLVGQTTATQVQLQVRDTGSGIPADRLAQIFEPLYTSKHGGTGLGLAIVQETVTAHRGQVTVESVEGQGTTFTITLPRVVTETPREGF